MSGHRGKMSTFIKVSNNAGIKSSSEIIQQEVIDDLSLDSVVESSKMTISPALASPEAVDLTKLEELKAKIQENKTEQNMVVQKKEKSIIFGVVGSGQAGSRLAATWYLAGYSAIAINTANQDLKHIDLPDSNKLFLQYGLGGAAKDLEIGKAAAEAHRGEIAELIDMKLSDAQLNILCLSLGGGSGAGSCETLVDILSETGKPLVVITVLPMETEDAQTKHNALATLVKLTNLTKTKKINNLIVVDNAKIETIYQNVSQVEFFGVANKAIVDTIDVFNTLSAQPSPVKPLDSMEFAKLFTDGEGLTVYGELTVENYEHETAIAEAVMNNLSTNLLADGFNLKQSKYVGVIIAANSIVWKNIPSSHVNYAMSLIDEQCGNPNNISKGIYVVDDIKENVVKVYSMFSGLGLPTSRVEQLKKDSELSLKTAKGKDEQRNLTITLNTGTNETVSQAQQIKNKIAQKSSAFGKLTQNVIDRRSK